MLQISNLILPVDGGEDLLRQKAARVLGVRPRLVGQGQDLQLRLFQKLLHGDLGVAGVGSPEMVVEAPEQGGALAAPSDQEPHLPEHGHSPSPIPSWDRARISSSGFSSSCSMVINWRSSGQLLYTNWLNYYVYQTTPYDPTRISLEPQE